MKDINLVTTFHSKGLELYGQRFLDSFADKVDKNIKLLVYAEDCDPINPDPERITIYDAKETLTDLQEFKKKWQDVPKAKGVCPFPEKRPKDYHKEFKWDAIRFSNKVYAVFDAVKKSSEWCVWIDADCYIHTPWSYKEFSELLPNDVWITYVGRGKKSNTWPECGFYGLNLKQKTCQKFIEKFKKMYDNAEEGIFSLNEWHDSYVFGVLLTEMESYNSNILNYSNDLAIKGAQTGGGGHPIINTNLGKWIDHLKGNRKYDGMSKKSDVVVNRNQNYWDFN